jgi:hypothetical protein
MKNNIKAEIIAHSKRANTGEEIITYRLTFPRIILSEVNTYKMLEKNTSSSRAIPFDKMVEVVEKEPFIPIAWQLSHKGMQGIKYITDPRVIGFKEMRWLNARNGAVDYAKSLVNDDVTIKKLLNTSDSNKLSKNYGNRLLEPFMWTTQLITGTRESFEHLFEQRCPIYNVENLKFISKKDAIFLFPSLKDLTDLEWLQRNKGQAEIHFMDLAEKMYDALNESTPDVLKEGEWHIPFQEEIWKGKQAEKLEDVIKMSCAMTARVSYTTINDNEVLTLEKAKNIYDKCVKSGHFSVVSHCAKCMTYEEYENWYKGFMKTTYYFDENGKQHRVMDSEDFHKAKGYNKNLRGFISLRQYIEDSVELKDI